MDETDGLDTRASGTAPPGWFRVPDGRLLYWDGTAWQTDGPGPGVAQPRKEMRLPSSRQMALAIACGVTVGLLMGRLWVPPGEDFLSMEPWRLVVVSVAGAILGVATEYLRVVARAWVFYALGLATVLLMVTFMLRVEQLDSAGVSGGGFAETNFFSMLFSFVTAGMIAGHHNSGARRPAGRSGGAGTEGPPAARSLPSGGAK